MYLGGCADNVVFTVTNKNVEKKMTRCRLTSLVLSKTIYTKIEDHLSALGRFHQTYQQQSIENLGHKSVAQQAIKVVVKKIKLKVFIRFEFKKIPFSI